LGRVIALGCVSVLESVGILTNEEEEQQEEEQEQQSKT
jgi:hypothetical protein